MERYKAFLSEIKRENEKIGRKIRFVNHKSKFQPVNGKKVGYNKFFVNSYEVEKKNNLCKYYKHKIDRSRGKKKGKIHNDGFPFFEVYKNTNPAFKNNLPQYGLLQMLKSYDELELFQFCSRRKEGINFFTPLLSHFIEIVIRKRDLYRISDVLLLTEHIKKLNYYHPYFCKLVCRELSPFYRFVHGPYSSEVFPYIYKQVLEATPRGGSNFVPLLKSFYTISKEFGTALDVDLHNATLEIYGHTGGAQGGLSGGGVSPPSYVLSGGSRKKGKKARSGGGGGNANANGSENANANTNRSANTNCVDRRAGGENPFAPFNCDANSNLKRLNLGDEALAGAHHEEEEHYDERHYEEHHHEEHYDWLPSEGLPSEKAFRDLVDTVKHVVLLIELKLLSAFPFAREKGPAEIEFVKRVNFHADREKSVHKYNALNGHHFDDSELNFLFYRNYGDEPGTATMGDINAFLKSKPDVKFNLTDGTYFAHVFSHLWQVQGCQKGRVTKNKYGYSTTEKHTENDALYKMLSEILVKKIINIKSERLYKVILSCGNTAYSDVYLNHFLKKFNRHVKFRKMRKYINC
ncbi:hypothetical protein PVBG_01856 [Plasmodium vivax Brazil I]|uniref:Uncharacterized protein n=1 Tax=Plasmodium vivax (strain Brazil I) TaxID=1033975 RepID=A0A0J9VHZ2_PLAV1|nr:hypothetical protein PVBG_01856 [Plasmodium vivax Brazil I]